MEITATLDVSTRAAWRTWLKKNHARVTEIWLVFRKKKSGKASVAYGDAVEEALCFGWIDGQVKTIDDERYAQRFTPRKPSSGWSKLNVERVRRLIDTGLMAPAGMATITPDILDGTSPRIVDQGDWQACCARLEEALSGHRSALANYRGLTLSARKQYGLWVMSARKQETRDRRLAEAIGRLERNEKLGMK